MHSRGCARQTRGLTIAWWEDFLREVRLLGPGALQEWLDWMDLSSCFYIGGQHDALLPRLERHIEIIRRGDESITDINMDFLAHAALRIAQLLPNLGIGLCQRIQQLLKCLRVQ